jgi:hypothetical protein
MHSTVARIYGAFRFMLACSLLAAIAATPAPQLLKSALEANPTLQSYTAKVSLGLELHVIIPIHRTFTGTMYYLRPKRKIIFDNVSGPLARFKELDTTLPSYDGLVTEYTLASHTDNAQISTYTLTPTDKGRRVERLTVEIDEGEAQIDRAQWDYTNGGHVSVVPTYAGVDTFRLPVKEDISVRFPGYSVHGTMQIFNYNLNVAVAPSVFDANGATKL